MVLESPEEVLVFRYNPLNPEMIAAGCLNGQVALWDTSSDDVGPFAYFLYQHVNAL